MPEIPAGKPDAGLHDDRYQRLVENSLGLICAHDLDGNLLFVNAAAARALGYTADEGVGRNLREFLATGTRHLFDEYLTRIRIDRVDEGLMRVVDKFGRERVWMYRNTRSEQPGEPPLVVGHALDITERVSTERSLRASEQAVKRAYEELQGRIQEGTEELQAVNARLCTEIADRQREPAHWGTASRGGDAVLGVLAEAAPVMLRMSGPDKLCTYFNRPWLEFTGRSMDEELGAGWLDGVHRDDRARTEAAYEAAFDRREPFRLEYRLRRHDGEFRWMLDAGVPRTTLDDGAFAGYIGSCVDINEHKLSQDVLAGLSRHLIEAQESERTWIARELREDLAQRTVALAMQLHSLARVLPDEASRSVSIREMCDQAAALGRDIEAISRRLQCSRLEYLGLVSAAAGLCNELSDQYHVHIVLTDDSIPEDVPRDVGLTLFRVLREALTNAARHAGVREIAVVLRGSPDEISLDVVDEGIGFDLDAARRKGLGLIGMQERLNLVGGSMSIRTRPGAGTALSVRVPFERTR
jgi:PAS domain S-box-containing protein